MNTQPLPSAPQLGAQVPGTTGGLPALSGLSVTKNPMAQELQSYGRGDDTMLVHMTPNEVNSLQGLAMAHGGSLTINPHTGLPEAGWLGKLLPTILGVAGAAFGIPTWAIGLGVGAGQTALTGDLGKGLAAGLAAFGGAGLGQAAGIGGSLGNVGQSLGLTQGATTAAGASGAATTGAASPMVAAEPLKDLGVVASDNIARMNAGLAINPAMSNVAPALPGLAPSIAQNAIATQAPIASTVNAGSLAGNVGPKPGFLSTFAKETNIPGLGKIGPIAAGMGVLSNVSEAFAPKLPTYKEEKDEYGGPYQYGERKVIASPTTEELKTTSGERTWFSPSQPQLLDASGKPVFGFGSTPTTTNAAAPATGAPRGFNLFNIAQRLRGNKEETDPFSRSIWNTFAKGGEVDMRDGSFVVDARTVSELGNGSSNAGIELLSKMGGRPVRGPGDGVSDSVPARIGGKQEARVARDEVIFPPEAVRRVGGGNEARGTKKLYALMDKAHAARRKSARGKDTGLRKGLA